MNTDNQWHEGLIVEHADKSFGLYDTIEEAYRVALDKLPKTTIRFQPVKYCWNDGQPVVDFGDFKMNIRL